MRSTNKVCRHTEQKGKYNQQSWYGPAWQNNNQYRPPRADPSGGIAQCMRQLTGALGQIREFGQVARWANQLDQRISGPDSVPTADIFGVAGGTSKLERVN